MVLVDTSVWVDHFQRGNAVLAGHLGRCEVLTHPFVIGELALSGLQQRATVLELLQNLPAANVASPDEMLRFISANALHGTGIGYVDAHLLAAVRLTPGSQLWTLDKRLAAAAARLGLAAQGVH